MKKIYFILALMCACMYMNAEELFSKTVVSFDNNKTYFYSITGITAGTTCPNDLVIPDSLPTSEMTGGIKKLPVKQIADNAFNGLPINSVKIPAPVEMIGANAFNNCTSLRRMYIYADDITLTGGSSALTFNNVFATLYVPKNRVEHFNDNLGFGQFFPGGIFPIEEGAVSMTATEYTTTDNKIDIVWFLKEGVKKYILAVTDLEGKSILVDEKNEPVYALEFDANGNLISNASSESGNGMPARQLETSTTMGVGVASIGPLGNKKKYNYEVKGMDETDKEIMNRKGSFTLDTESGSVQLSQEHNEVLIPSSVEETQMRVQTARKVVIDGVVYIERDGQLLNMLGQEVVR